MQLRHLAAFAALAVSIPAVSQAQLGGLVRKAKDAAANKVVERSNLKPSNAFGPELTAESLDGVLRGLAASEAKINEADALRITRQTIDADLAQSYQKYDKDREAYEAKARSTESCQDTVIRARSAASQQAYMSRMQSDPAAQAKMIQAATAVSQKMSAAQQRGDTVEAKRLMSDLAKAQGIDPKADTLAAVKQCGAVPAKPAWLVEQNAARDRSTQLDGQIRERESGAQSAGASASGMSFREYSQARERVLNWWIEARGGTPIQSFGGDERKLLESKRGDIEKYQKGLQ